MSVYTAVDRQDLAAWLHSFAVGDLLDFAGIAAGVENSNYFVTTTGGSWVLTLFERLPAAELDFYLGLMARLARQGFPCPQPQATAGGGLWQPLAGKPAALVSRLPGTAVEKPAPSHCRAVGAALARLHRLTADWPRALPNPRGAEWRETTGKILRFLLASKEQELLAAELDFQAGQDFTRLPRGVVHADLFRDNVLWQPDGALSGVLDFYFAGEDVLLFDLAVAANDWCPTRRHLQALLAGYESERSLSAEERAAWPILRRAAALRFWISRLEDSRRPRPGQVVTVKDPAHFGRMLKRLRLAPGAPAR